MIIKSAEFKCSSEKIEQCPLLSMPEYAFIGRSNVGKSSLINMITSRPSLAKVSGTPGKTRLINHFIINSEWTLVDLPGYGYAKASKKTRVAFEELITSYILNRDAMHCLFVLIDSRLEPQKIDLEFLGMLGENGVPFAIIFTKSDKLSTSALNRNVKNYQTTLLQQWEELPPIFISSAENGRGRDEILTYIENLISKVEE